MSSFEPGQPPQSEHAGDGDNEGPEVYEDFPRLTSFLAVQHLQVKSQMLQRMRQYLDVRDPGDGWEDRVRALAIAYQQLGKSP